MKWNEYRLDATKTIVRMYVNVRTPPEAQTRREE
jgi:hypothetical protein